MKVQMRFQKILVLVSLIIAALATVYAWIFCSGVFAQLTNINETLKQNSVSAALDTIDLSQQFTVTFQTLGIILILAVVLLYVFGCHSRRKYYITNYVAVGIVVVYMLVYVIVLFVSLSNVAAALAAVDFDTQCITGDVLNADGVLVTESIAEYYLSSAAKVFGDLQTTSWTIPVGYVLGVIVFADAAAIGLNLLWKLKLMKGEKQLLEQGLVKEVA